MATNVTVKAQWKEGGRPEIIARFLNEGDARQWACDAAHNGWGAGSAKNLTVSVGSCLMSVFPIRNVELP